MLGTDAIECRAMIAGNARSLFNATAPVIAAPALIAVILRAARALRRPNVNTRPMPRTLLKASGLCWIVTFVFVALAGFYSPRLSWLLVPPMLMLVVIEARALWEAMPRRRPWAISVALATVCMTYVLLLAARQGPYW